jgi:hypothetical protein
MAIQILPERPTVGEAFGTGLGSGLANSLQFLAEKRLADLSRREQSSRSAIGLQALGIPESEAQQISILPQQLQAPIIQNYLKGAETTGLMQALGMLGEPGIPAAVPLTPTDLVERRPEEVTPTGAAEKGLVASVLREPRLSPEHAIKISEMRDKRRRFEEKLKTEKRKELLQDQRESNKETLDYYKTTNKLAKGAKEGELRLSRMEVLNERGKMGLPIFNSFLKTVSKGIFGLGIDLTHLMSADAQEFDKLSTDFLKNVKDIFGARITDREVALFLKTVPTLSQSKTGRQRVIRNLRIFNEAAKLRQKAMTEIVKANKGNRPRNIESLVEEMVDPQLDALSKEFKGGEVGAAPFHEAFYD